VNWRFEFSPVETVERSLERWWNVWNALAKCSNERLSVPVLWNAKSRRKLGKTSRVPAFQALGIRTVEHQRTSAGNARSITLG